MKTVPFFRRLALVLVPLLLIGSIVFGSAQIVFGQVKSGGSRLHHVAPSANIGPAGTSHALTTTNLTGSSNPIAFGEPVILPSTHPTVIPILNNQAFGNAPAPVQSTLTLPAGRWQKAVLTITGTQQGRQFDRLLLIWAGNTQIFTGVTPEPTQAGIAWSVQKDVTAYLPLLSGSQTFTTWIDNYVTSVYTGIPVISLRLALYPRHDQDSASVSTAWEQDQADSIVALTSSPAMVTVHPNTTLTATLNLPHDVAGAYLLSLIHI